MSAITATIIKPCVWCERLLTQSDVQDGTAVLANDVRFHGDGIVGEYSDWYTDTDYICGKNCADALSAEYEDHTDPTNVSDHRIDR